MYIIKHSQGGGNAESWRCGVAPHNLVDKGLEEMMARREQPPTTGWIRRRGSVVMGGGSGGGCDGVLCHQHRIRSNREETNRDSVCVLGFFTSKSAWSPLRSACFAPLKRN